MLVFLAMLAVMLLLGMVQAAIDDNMNLVIWLYVGFVLVFGGIVGILFTRDIEPQPYVPPPEICLEGTTYYRLYDTIVPKLVNGEPEICQNPPKPI